MNAALKTAAALTFAVLIGCAAGCGRNAPAAHHLDPSCRAAIAALPAHPPVTRQQALADAHAVDRVRGKDNMVRGMAHIVGGALSKLGLDIASGHNASAGRVTYSADVEVLKSYCHALSRQGSQARQGARRVRGTPRCPTQAKPRMCASNL